MNHGGELKILLVEDCDSDARLLSESILSAGHDLGVTTVQSLREAVEFLKSNHADATLLDLSLPDSSGLATAKHFRRSFPPMPVVVLTGVEDEKTAMEAVRMGVQDYLVKGRADGALITRAVRYAVERKRAEERLRRLTSELKRRAKDLEETNKTLSDSHRAALNLMEDALKTRKALQESEREIAEKSLLLENMVRKQGQVIIDTKETLDMETRERLRVQEELTHRQQALEAIYAMATAFNFSEAQMNDQAVMNVAKILKTPFAAICRVSEKRTGATSLFYEGKLIQRADSTLPCLSCRREILPAFGDRTNRNFTSSIQSASCFPEMEVRASISVPVRNGEGEARGMICALDSAKRKFEENDFRLLEIFGRYLSHERSRRELESQLMRANEMKVLGQLTSGVAHEVRNPLNGIMAIMSALSKEIGESARFQPYLRHMRNQIIRLTTLMEDLLALGRPIREENKSEIPIVELVQKALESWGNGLEKPREVSFDPPRAGAALAVRVDGAKIEQVIVNLLENARQHSDHDKPITLSVGATDRETARISVTDNGRGIKDDIMPRIFEPFFTTRKGGTGLGLCIVKHIVESHGGSIEACNNRNVSGATFTFTLPLLQKPA